MIAMGRDAEASIMGSMVILCLGFWDFVDRGHKSGLAVAAAGLVILIVVIMTCWIDSKRGSRRSSPVLPPEEDE